MIKCKTKSGIKIIDNNIDFKIIDRYVTRSTHISYVVFSTVVYAIFNSLVNIHQHFYNTASATPMYSKIFILLIILSPFPYQLFWWKSVIMYWYLMDNCWYNCVGSGFATTLSRGFEKGIPDTVHKNWVLWHTLTFCLPCFCQISFDDPTNLVIYSSSSAYFFAGCSFWYLSSMAFYHESRL